MLKCFTWCGLHRDLNSTSPKWKKKISAPIWIYILILRQGVINNFKILFNVYLLSFSTPLTLSHSAKPVLRIGGSKKERLPLQFVSTLGSSLPWAWHKLQLSPAAQVTDRNPSLFWDLAKSSNCLAPVGAGVRLAPPWEHSELKEKPLLMVHTNDLYILIRNAWVKITRWNLNEQRKAYYLLLLCFSTARKSNKLTWIRSEQISRKLIRNLWFSPSWKYQIFPLQSQET